MIQGSIRGTADRLSVTMQLIEVHTGVRLWAERFDIDGNDSAELRNEATGRVALTLFEKLIEDISRRVEARRRADWDTEDLLMRGVALVYRPAIMQNSPDSARREALQCFEQALARAPDSLVAKIGVATVLILTIAVGESLSGRSDAERAERLLTDVLRVDGRIAHAHFWMGMLRQMQFRLRA